MNILEKNQKTITKEYCCINQPNNILIHGIIDYDENEGENEKYDINGTRPGHGCEYIKYKMCLSMMTVVCSKQHLSNIWSWIYEKVKQHWSWV